MKILFLGSPNFAKIVLESLLNAGHEIVAVVCQPDHPAGRGKKLQMPETKVFALEKGLKVLQFDKVNAHLDEIRALDFDIFVTASFGQILSREFLQIKMGLNVHPSLLPELRGATPIQTALLQNRTLTGVTIQRMVYEVDAGDILEQEQLEIGEEEDYVSLERRLADLSCKLLNAALAKLENGQAQFKPQVGTPSFTRMIKKEDGRLDFNKTAKQLFGVVRALSYNPSCYFEIGGQRIKVLKAKVSEETLPSKEIAATRKRFLIGCKEGSLEILQLTAPSGKKMDGASFLNGNNARKVD